MRDEELNNTRDRGEVDVRPIKADRWSTGQVLLYLLDKFREEDRVLRTTRKRLTPYNPEQRLSLLQVAASPSDVENVAVKRKALRDTVEVDWENAKPPSVKRQKLSVPDRNKRAVLAELCRG
jgi:hypothetical protein